MAQPAPAAADSSAGEVKTPTLSEAERTALRAQIDRELRALAGTLKLTDEQRAKARPILLDHDYQVNQLRTRYSGIERSPMVMKSVTKDMQRLRDSTDAKMAGVLTADQMVGYKKWRDQGLTRMRSKMGITGAPAPTGKPTHAHTPAPADTTRKK